MSNNPQGIIIYEGPSVFTGEKIAVIATGLVEPSTNRKTGPMIQVYFLSVDTDPRVDAKMDESGVCFDCPLKDGACYVRVDQGPLIVWKAYHTHYYKRVTLAETRRIFKNRAVRFGAYGDPACVDPDIFLALFDGSYRHTMYTHFWRTATHLKEYAMASVSTAAEAETAQRLGWKTFRITKPDEYPMEREIICPAMTRDFVQCIGCLLCDGRTGKSITVPVHGTARKIKKFLNK